MAYKKLIFRPETVYEITFLQKKKRPKNINLKKRVKYFKKALWYRKIHLGCVSPELSFIFSHSTWNLKSITRTCFGRLWAPNSRYYLQPFFFFSLDWIKISTTMIIYLRPQWLALPLRSFFHLLYGEVHQRQRVERHQIYSVNR